MLIVVGGHTRNIGKTSVTAAIVAAFPEMNWTAVKITQSPGECTAAVAEEHETQSGTDSSRLLKAGAKRSYWLRTGIGDLGCALPQLRQILGGAPNAIVESNSVLQFIEADLYLCVADFAKPDFKPTSLRYLDRADALIVTGGDPANPAWGGVDVALWNAKPRFSVSPPRWMTPELRDRLQLWCANIPCRAPSQ